MRILFTTAQKFASGYKESKSEFKIKRVKTLSSLGIHQGVHGISKRRPRFLMQPETDRVIAINAVKAAQRKLPIDEHVKDRYNILPYPTSYEGLTAVPLYREPDFEKLDDALRTVNIRRKRLNKKTTITDPPQ